MKCQSAWVWHTPRGFYWMDDDEYATPSGPFGMERDAIDDCRMWSNPRSWLFMPPPSVVYRSMTVQPENWSARR